MPVIGTANRATTRDEDLMLPNCQKALRKGAGRLTIAALVGTAAALPLATGFMTPLNAATESSVQLPGSFADLVESVSPAVVSVVTRQPAPHAVSQHGLPGLPPDSPFAPFFRDFGLPMPEGGTPAPQAPGREGTGLGSGFIIDPAGYVVTNNHVVGEATSIEIVLQDGTRLDASIVGRDEKVDLALLKVESADELPYLTFGDSDGVRVGDWTIAVGNPFGLGGTVTAGIVSARGRDINSGPYDDYLQLDAPINRGNSGGPTFDVHGEVIGINTAIFSPNGGNVGIGFAIPSNLAAPLIAELREQGYVSRGWLGVQIQSVTPAIAESLELGAPEGALVAQVTPDSPAAAAGLEVGDVILEFAGEPVATVRDLTRQVALAEIGDEQSMRVWRHGDEVMLDVAPGQAPSTQVADASSVETPTDLLGLKLAGLDAAAREAAGLADDAQGVLVVEVTGEAAEWLAPGDVILTVDNQPVSSPADVAARVAAAEAHERSAVLMLVNRQGEQRFATLDIRHA
jgi:serine protease Do